MAGFKVFQGRSELGRYHFTDGCIRIGRHPDCEIQLLDPSVSRNHAEVNRKGEAWVLKISQSRNGMFVNGNMVSFRVLKDGDRIEIAHFVIQFEENEDSADGTQAPAAQDANSQFSAFDDRDSTTVTISLQDALKIHELNTEVMGAHIGWYEDKEEENIVSLNKERILIGSTAECDVHVTPRDGFQGLCAAVQKSGAGFVLEPLAEANNLKVNLVPITETTPLKDGDRIMWGGHILMFREPLD